MAKPTAVPDLNWRCPICRLCEDISGVLGIRFHGHINPTQRPHLKKGKQYVSTFSRPRSWKQMLLINVETFLLDLPIYNHLHIFLYNTEERL